MTARLLSGKEFAAKFKEDAAKRARAIEAAHGVTPGLAVIIVGEDPASQVYVRNKDRACAELGIYSEVLRMPATTTKAELIAKIDELNYDKRIHGILVQLPLPEALHREEQEILDRIDPAKDVDGFHPVNVGRLSLGQPALVPCTPSGCLKMLELAGISIDGARAVIVGRSNIVGKPMAQLLLAKNATVTVCRSHTKDLAAVTREADILVAAVGKPKFITADMVKPGTTVIDVGINRIAPKKLVGDVDFDAVQDVAGAITPVPGGVGLLTVAMLMENVVTAAELQLSK
ncbi:MAG: bifunctional methylenetetrahydrofolate dehydrogenase/methenyltetrahydrofolate cyclohydrolase FolD [Veillonellaceae bacterium]|nr:bifunctional methylenetetrahydrofolate dehydrogenase/methenyltetrahydrofolate cyclohydrolase FolD [Veillonellaceae bacterium]